VEDVSFNVYLVVNTMQEIFYWTYELVMEI
jgi:hypothetical protein